MPRKKNICFLILLLLAFAGPFLSAKEEIIINNRILAKVHGKPITLFDVVKKLDLLFYRQFPEYAGSTAARYEFYNANWKNVLDDLIQKDLILLDAEEAKLTIGNGEVREEMERIFGPNVVFNLEKAKLSFDEAYKLVINDLTMRRMLFIRVYGKANRKITPEQLHSYYLDWAEKNKEEEKWIYRVITFRGVDPKKGLAAAKALYEDFKNEPNIDKLVEAYRKKHPELQIASSGSLEGTSGSLSESYRLTLAKMNPKDLAEPAFLQSRKLGTVVRLFYLEDHKLQGAPSYQKMEAKLRTQLADEITEKEMDCYFAKLKSRFHVEKFCDAHEKLAKENAFIPFLISYSR